MHHLNENSCTMKYSLKLIYLYNIHNYKTYLHFCIFSLRLN